MGEVIAQGRTPSGANWRVEGVGPWLDLLPKGNRDGARNNVMRLSMLDMGYVWASKFLGRRFTNYLRTAPFGYYMGVEKGVSKFRRMGLLQPILNAELYGWDPWSHASPPRELIEDYRRRYPEAKGAFSRSGNYFTLSRTIRADSKRIIRDMVDDLMTTKVRPLVETGGAERSAIAGHRVTATATAKNARITIGIPFGAARNAVVGKLVRMMPQREVAFCAKALGEILTKRLSKTGVAAPGPLPVSRGTNDGSRARI